MADLLINGAVTSWADIDFRIVGVPGLTINAKIDDIRSLDYGYTQPVAFGHASGPNPVFRNRGAYQAQGSIEWGFETLRLLLQALARTGLGGFGDVRFGITVSYALTQTSAIKQDLLGGVRLVGLTQDNASGGHETTTRTQLSIASIRFGGDGKVTQFPVPAFDAIS